MKYVLCSVLVPRFSVSGDYDQGLFICSSNTFIALLSTANQNVNLEGRVGAGTDFSTPQHVLRDQIVDTLKVLGFMALQADRSESSGF